MAYSQLPQELILHPLEKHLDYLGRTVKESIYEDHKGFIWVATSKGYFRWDGKEWSQMKLFENGEKNNLEGKDILYRPDIGYIFSAGTNGVVIYNDKDDSFNNITSIIVNNKEVPFTAMNANAYGYQTLVSTNEGAIILGEKGNIIEIDRPEDDNPGTNHTGHHKNGIRHTLIDREKRIYYYGGNGGLYSRHYKEENCIVHPQPYVNDYHIDKSVKNFQLQYIYLSDKKVYGPSWGNGIMIFDIENKTWDRRLGLEDAQRSVALNMLNTHGNNWLVTRISKSSGIGFFNEKHDHIIDVLDHNSKPLKSSDAITKDNCGRIWISSSSDIETYKYPPIMLVDNPKSIYIKSLAINNELQNTSLDYWDNKIVKMLPSQSKIDISFRAINPLSYDSINYEYRLKGIHKEWRENKNKENISYDIIGSGEYVFEVRSWNKHTQKYIYSGPLLIKKSVLDFNNPHTQIKVGGALISIFSFLFLGYFLFYKSRIKRKDAEFQSKLLEVQTLALRSQMNPHFLFNCMNSIRYFIVKNENQKAAEYLTKFSRLMRNILENSTKESITVTEEINTLNLYLEMEKLRFEDKFDYSVNYIGSRSSESIRIPTMIIQPFVENALIHGIKNLEGEGLITVTIEDLESTIKCTIYDNGVGRDHANKQNSVSNTFRKSSLGMKITQQRLTLLKKTNNQIIIKDLRDAEGNPTGTKVIVLIDK